MGEEALVEDRWDRASWERALMGALLEQPLLIRAFAVEHPPAWFADDGALALMRALYCLSSLGRDLRVEDLVNVLDRHGALDLVGGREAVEVLVAPRPELDAAQAELQALRRRLPAEEQESLDREETLASLDELLAAAEVGAPVPVVEVALSSTPQLELFSDAAPRGHEKDR